MNLNFQILHLGLGGPSESPFLQQFLLKRVKLCSEDPVDALASISEHSVQVKSASNGAAEGGPELEAEAEPEAEAEADDDADTDADCDDGGSDRAWARAPQRRRRRKPPPQAKSGRGGGVLDLALDSKLSKNAKKHESRRRLEPSTCSMPDAL
eukprot:CAMPEP_0204210610 /NCGR_PEP_ID=MMETSP0361-20130328/74053_1 /ASSEMBLY_ACC=CAM_ASM_000343 /TAXON_ID=268821 /ORGANISM="Scrippsiella Hangoei, Strain SHTV-5" /LENGTH=152 /DNA_ID=CAMNT_0051174755 /DNA_START=261 /DNA_END=718 /DNA_ORIENTATION=+